MSPHELVTYLHFISVKAACCWIVVTNSIDHKGLEHTEMEKKVVPLQLFNFTVLMSDEYYAFKHDKQGHCIISKYKLPFQFTHTTVVNCDQKKLHAKSVTQTWVSMTDK